jgi:hypothetical protein
MDTTAYQNIFNYLTNFITPANLTIIELKAFKKQATQYFIQNGQLYKKNRYLPNQPLRVIQAHELETLLFDSHANILSGHFGIDGTYNKIKDRYYWPNRFKSVQDYVKSCDVCQRQGSAQGQGPLHPISVGNAFDRIGIDIVGPLEITDQGNRYIVVATEYLTKWPEARAIPDMTASTVAKFIYEDIICRHGCPKEILSDQGKSFCNELVDNLCKLLEIRHRLASPYHPQTNGLTERFNKTLCESLAKYVTAHEAQWDTFIPSVLFAYRTLRQATTKYEPFKLLYGREAKTPLQLQFEQEYELDAEKAIEAHKEIITEELAQLREDARKNIQKRQAKQKEHHDEKVREKQYQIGDKVLLYDSAKKNVHGDKFRPKWNGPYYIHNTLGKGAYQLRTMDGKVLKRSVNVDRLKAYYDRSAWEPIVFIS